MLWILGIIIVSVSVFLGYTGGGGHLNVLWQPFEFLIIVGAAVGAFLTSNTKTALGMVPLGLAHLLRGPRYNKTSYLELLSLLYVLFKLARTKGMLVLESHIDRPKESALFAQFPKFLEDEEAVTFLCDYLRLLTMGTDNPNEVSDLFDEEMSTHHAKLLLVPNAIQQMADGMPALGIVAAVLGVIHTMGSITEPPEVLGHLIGGALVGTFLGVLLSYGFIGPVANGIHAIYEMDLKYFECIKVGLLAHLNGYAPAVSVEFARKVLYQKLQPSFYEVEEAVSGLSVNI